MGIEAALLGQSALPWLTGSAAAASATTGLLGAGGALSLGGVGSLFSGLSGASSLFGGMSANAEAKNQAATAQAEATLRAEETGRATAREAMLVGAEAESVRRRQKLAYLKSGVDLEGSPLLMMEATRKAGLDNAEEVMRAGGMTAGAQIQEGRARATQLKSSGRQAFISGLGGAASSLARMA